jgi:hypothetical protein
VGNSRGELEEKLTLRAVCKKVLVGAAVPSRAGWRQKKKNIGKTSLEQIYIEGLKAKCTTQETYKREPGTIATTLGCLGVP